MESINSHNVTQLFEVIAHTMQDAEETLCRMDAQMGDGDLGITMRKGFSALPAVLSAMEPTEPGRMIAKAGIKMNSVVPSTMGTLMASGLIYGGKAISGRNAVDAEGLCSFLEGFSDGIITRGKCSRGDRTVLDSIAAAADSCRALWKADPGITIQQAAQAALEGAQKGLQDTKNMEPKFGKAAVHKAAARGTEDQGACAGMYFILGIRNFICDKV